MAVLVGACFCLGYLIVGGGRSLLAAIGVASAPAALAFIAADLRDIRAADARSRLCVAAVACLPLLASLHSSQALIVAQSIFALTVVFLFASAQSERREEWLRMTGPLRLIGGLFALTLVVSYVASGVSSANEAGYLVSLLLSSVFFFVPILIVGNLRRFEWLLAILLIVGASQGLVVAAQAAGLTDGLPGPLSVLDTTVWGGPLAAGNPARYPGTFDDVELLAEYASLVTVLGVGLAAVSRRRSFRVLGVLCAAGAVVAGLLTGTRGYVVAAVIGLGVLALLLLPRRSGGRAAPLARVAAIAALLVATVYTVVPDAVRATMLGRFAGLELTGPNAFNRAPLFDAWMQLAVRMPLLGYGARMLDTIRAAYSYSGVTVVSPHSLYFWILLTAGTPGLAAFLILICTLLIAQLRVYRAGTGPSHAWAAVFVAVLVAWLANEYKIDCVRSPLYVSWLVFVLGMPLALFAASRDRTEEIRR